MTHTHYFTPVKGSYLMECTQVYANRQQCTANKHEITGRVFTGLTSHDKEIR